MTPAARLKLITQMRELGASRVELQLPEPGGRLVVEWDTSAIPMVAAPEVDYLPPEPDDAEDAPARERYVDQRERENDELRTLLASTDEALHA